MNETGHGMKWGKYSILAGGITYFFETENTFPGDWEKGKSTDHGARAIEHVP